MRTILTGFSDLEFSIIGVNGDIAISVNVNFYPVAKMPIDLKAAGGIGAGFHEYGEDLGEPSLLPSSPIPPKDLPPGITEVYQS